MMYTLAKQLDGYGMLEELMQWMVWSFEDLTQMKTAFTDAVNTLQQSLDQGSVQAETDAIMQQTVSDLLFSCWLGFKANWEHFTDPTARSFLEVDPEVYLQEHIAHNMPDYRAAQDARERFYEMLTPEQQTVYEAVDAYVCYLETTVPKLAHYYGYLLGNQLLPKLIPGYLPDHTQTLRYKKMLEHYLGEKCLPMAL